ncbi:MAG: nascent polypeptide-associated complex protein [Euryarchaeota archaeon]|nr:nascent polypeptide-associated complex protein [Euryarchaeota archaeon]MBV1729411.1 nascent polypeptide-associated complex protein [Methanobacterium sp.]MBU4548394.1 nascent polypeptide-associated complex protein [Euryarchaeota archaeon]MBU4607339.1 nascent polypeptide-associated complex protein [Euryarchaeota archaeon]MBV1755621.1 nascent polypeptide-associated complex protein [Methanobacterium sp.]
MIPGMGMNPKQLKQMQRSMKQMGMDMKEVHGATEVIIKLKNKEIIIKNPKVNIMDFMGQKTYQITGKPKEKAIKSELVIPAEDIELVVTQAGVTPEEAEKALKETKGDLAEAILRLS